MMPRTDEPRSFAPRGEDVKTRPVTSRNPSNTELGRGINDLHACLEDTRGDVQAIKDDVSLMKRAFVEKDGGAARPKVRAHWDTMTVATVIGATGGGLLLFKALAAILPAMAHALAGVHL